MTISKLSKTLVGQVHVRSSALNPLLWQSGVAIVLFLFAAYFIPEYRGLLIISAIVSMAAVYIAYAYFAVKDPNRLQSEEFQIRHHEMQMMQSKQDMPLIIEDKQFLPNPLLTEDADSGETK